MKIRQRLFSYPVLAGFSDDFPNCEFSCRSFECTPKDSSELVMSIQLNNNCQGLQDLISDKKAEYVCHLECPATHYRGIYRSSSPDFAFSILQREVNNIIEARVFITANQELEYDLNEFHPDYKGQKFKIGSGDILALAEGRNIELGLELKWAIPSIFKLESKAEKEGFYETNFEQQRIIISVDEDTYARYFSLKSTKEYQPILASTLVMPALVYAVERVVGSEDEAEGLSELRWFRAIKKRIGDLGLDTHELPPTIANKLVESLLNKSIKDIFNVGAGD